MHSNIWKIKHVLNNCVTFKNLVTAFLRVATYPLSQVIHNTVSSDALIVSLTSNCNEAIDMLILTIYSILSKKNE